MKLNRFPNFTEEEIKAGENSIFATKLKKNYRQEFWDKVQDKTKERIQTRIRITPEEYNQMRGNSWDWKVIGPMLNTSALIQAVEHNINNCTSIERTSRYETDTVYEEALINKWIPILLDRLEECDERIKAVINDIAEEVDRRGGHPNLGKIGCIRRLKRILKEM